MDGTIIDTGIGALSAVQPLPLDDLIKIMLSVIPVGFALGFMCLLLGLGISGVMSIFKRA